MNKKKIAILLGDPSGIGPELICKLLNEKITDNANIVVIGEKKILEDGEKVSKKKVDLKFVENFEQHRAPFGDQQACRTRGDERVAACKLRFKSRGTAKPNLDMPYTRPSLLQRLR